MFNPVHCRIVRIVEVVFIVALCLGSVLSAQSTPPWTPIGQQEHNMIALGPIYRDGTLLTGANFWVASYGPQGFTTDCRSLGQMATDGSYYATIRGTNTGDTIHFIVWDGNTGKAYPATETLAFTPDDLRTDFQLHCTTPSTPTLMVLSPNGGETIPWGSATYRILWSAWQVTGNITIELLKNGSLVKTVGTTSVTTGYYDWTLPTDVTPGGGYTIRLTQGTVTDSSDSTFALYLPGDVNGDGVRNSQDATVLVNWLTGNLSTVEVPAAADLDADGNVTILDLIHLLVLLNQ